MALGSSFAAILRSRTAQRAANRWLNAKIKLALGLKISDPYAHKCCKLAGIKSKSKHYRYKKPGEPRKVYPNLILAGLEIDGPMQCIVSDMTFGSLFRGCVA